MKNNIVCLGIDPGLARVGFGLVETDELSGPGLRALNYGCIETKPTASFTERLLKIYTGIQEQIAEGKPDLMSVERLFFGRNATTAGNVWQARGVIMLLAAQYSLPVIELAPNNIKRAVCGTGKADKHAVQEIIRDILLLKDIPRPDDTADALAAAVAGLSLYTQKGDD